MLNNKLNYLLNYTYFNEQLNNKTSFVKKNLYFNKIKINFYIKNREKNRFLFFTNLLLLERSSGQRIIFVKETINSPRIKPIKVGCSILLRNEYLFNFLKMLVHYSFPKLCDLIKKKNNKLSKQNLIFLNINYFLFLSSFSFSNDFDKFLSFYEDFNYYLSIELYSGFYKFLINKPLLSNHGLSYL
jgi:hypothetical protein